MSVSSVHAVIMAGGRGTRFWPLSRQSKPKQFLSIVENHTLLASTIHRMSDWIPFPYRWIVGSVDHQALLAPFETCVPKDHFLYEPVGKNTAPAIGWAAHMIASQDPHALLIVLPADHYITPPEAFKQTMDEAIKIASSNDVMVTIGIVPATPHTGYGYIQKGAPDQQAYRVEAFHEKPSVSLAQSYVASGDFLWNSGIFVFKASVILEAFRHYLPAHFALLSSPPALDDQEAIREWFSQFESISIDYGIMEKASHNTRVVPACFEWSDIGNWSALEAFWEKDEHQNAIFGKTIVLDSSRNLIYSPHRTLALIDVQDMIIVDTQDVVLILPKNKDQRIKDLLDQLPEDLL